MSKVDPRYAELLRDGSLERKEIPMDDVSTAVTLRARLYECRVQMRKEKHPFLPAAEAVSISVIGTTRDQTSISFSTHQRLAALGFKASDLEWKLVVENLDRKYTKTLEKAGYGIPEAPDLD